MTIAEPYSLKATTLVSYNLDLNIAWIYCKHSSHLKFDNKSAEAQIIPGASQLLILICESLTNFHV